MSFLFLSAVVAGFILHDLQGAYQDRLHFWDILLTNTVNDRIGVANLWLDERETDAQAIARNPTIIRTLGGSPGTKTHLMANLPEVTRDDMERVVHQTGVLAVAILNSRCQVVATAGPHSETIQDYLSTCQAVDEKKGIQIVDSGLEEGTLRINIAVPVFMDLTKEKRGGRGKVEGIPSSSHANSMDRALKMESREVEGDIKPQARHMVGTVVLVSDPWQVMLPYVIPRKELTKTCETLVIWPHGDQAVVFSESRLKQGNQAIVLEAMGEAKFEAEVVRKGEIQFHEFSDFRGVRVLGVARPIAWTGANLACKVDLTEALAEFRHRAILEGMSGSLPILVFGLVILIFHRRTTTTELLERIKQQGTLLQLKMRAEASQARYQDLFENAHDAVVMFDMQGRVVSFNKAAERASGYKREEALKMHVSEFLTSQFQDRFAGDLGHLISGDVPPVDEIHLKTKDGREVMLEASAQIAYEEGKPVGVQVIARDVSERKRAEEAIRASQEMFFKAFHASPEPICIVSLDEQIFLDANKSFCDQVGYAREEVIGKTPCELGLDPLAGFTAAQCGLLEQLELRDFELELRARSGEVITALISLQIVEIGSRKCILTQGRNITEKKRAEEALRRSEELFRAIVEDQTDMIHRWKPDGTSTFVNAAYCRMFGRPAEELVGSNIFDLVPKEEGEAVRQKVALLTPAHPAGTSMHSSILYDGSVAWYEWTDRGIFNADGHLVEVQSVGRDITEQRRAQEALRDSEQRYRDFITHSNEGVWRFEVEQPISIDLSPEETVAKLLQNCYLAECNDGLARIHGFTHAEQMVGRRMKDIVHPTDIERLALLYSASREGWRSRTVELHTVDQDGNPRFLLRTEVPIIENGMLVRVWGMTRDVTELKQAEAERARLMAAFDQTSEGVVITDLKGTIEYANPAFSKMTGYGHEEILGRDLRLLDPGMSEGTSYHKIWQTLLAGDIWNGELVNRRKDGILRTMKLTITPVRNERGEATHFIAIQEDITAQKSLEQQFQQAQRMEAVGRLAGGVAHDFNNVLQIINGYCELMLDELPPQETSRSYVRDVKDSVERAADLTRQLLAFSRQQVLQTRVLDLNRTIANMTKMLRRVIREDIELVTIEGRALGRVKADPGQLEQVILNLAVNARDAMPQGGKLTIETANVELDETYTSEHFPMLPGSYVMLAVGDTGSGMNAKTQAQIFEPFFTTKEKGKGTGLGLATVYGIVKQSGGYIWSQSEVGKGTTFKIYLPLVKETPEVEEEKPTGAAQGGSETVLLVEDEERVRSLVRRDLEAKGYNVLEARNGHEGLSVANRSLGPIHLLMTDVVMPGMGGRELAERLAPLHQEMKVLYVSGYPGEAIPHHEVLNSGVALLQKPFTADVLAAAVREVLEQNKEKCNRA